ncbi:MAG: S8 family serine peptidase [Flavobacteriaceae bacterium]|nr:MAG: S8 family serine peptidase [Flavobacteriaceae bacterium]
MKKTITVCLSENAEVKNNFNTIGVKSGAFKRELKLEPFLQRKKDKNRSFIASYETMNPEERKLYRLYKLEVDTSELEAVKNQLSTNPDVDFFEVSKTIETKYSPNDPSYPKLYGLQKIECEDAWNISKGDGITVAVIDTGVDYNHPDIKNNMWQKNGSYGYDFSSNNNDPMDYSGHGTHVAGTIGAIANNNLGIAGVSPKVKIMAVKIFPYRDDNPDSIVKALKYAADNGAKILNNSWGFTERTPSSPTIEAAIDYVHAKGGICVFAAGNENDNVKYYSPANYKNTISVGATDKNDDKPRFSNFGKGITVYAPGKDILSLERGTNGYAYKDGTSMATPHVSGALALNLAIHSYKNLNHLKHDLKTKSDIVNNRLRLNCNKLLK